MTLSLETAQLIELTQKTGWRRLTFAEMAENITERVEPAPTDGETYVGLEHLDPGSLIVRRWGADVSLVGTKLRMRKGDILFGKRNAYLQRVALAPHDGLFSAHGMVLRARPRAVLPEFLPFFMQSDLFMERAKKISVGSLSPTINWKTLAKEEFALPPPEEQRQITEVLVASRATVQSHEELVQPLVGLRKSLAEQLTTEGIGHSRFMASEIGRIPSDWKVVRLGDLCTEVRDGPHFSPKYVDDNKGVPFLSGRNVLVDGWSLDDVKYVSLEDHREFCKRARPEFGDILYTKGGTTGIAKVNDLQFEFSIWVHIALLKLRKEKVTPAFLAYCLNATSAYRQSQMYTHGTSNQDLGLQRMVEIKLPLPPMDEQELISERLDALVAAMRMQRERLDHARQQHRSAINSLIGFAEVA